MNDYTCLHSADFDSRLVCGCPHRVSLLVVGLLMKLGKEANTVCSHCGSSRHTDRQCHVYHYAMKLTGQDHDERFLPDQVYVMTEEEFMDTLDQIAKVKKLADRG